MAGRYNFGDDRGKVPTPYTQPVGKGMIVQQAADKFLVVGSHSCITFNLTGKKTCKVWQYVKVEEGQFKKEFLNQHASSVGIKLIGAILFWELNQ